MEFISKLIFIKIVLQAVRRFKNVEIKKRDWKDCDKKEEIRKIAKKLDIALMVSFTLLLKIKGFISFSEGIRWKHLPEMA